MFGFPAETVHTWSNALFIMAIVFAAVLSFLIFQSSSLVMADKQRALDAYKSEAQVMVTAAQKDGDAARAAIARSREHGTALAVRAAGLEKDVADARERIADLEKQTASATATAEQAVNERTQLQAMLEHEKTSRAEFESQFSWRVLSDEQRSTLMQQLSGAAHAVAIEFPGGDQEAQFLSLQLTKVFQDAGWKVALRSNPSAPLLFGLNVPGPANDVVNLVRQALAGIDMRPSELDAPATHTGEAARSTPECRIMVGGKLTDVVRRVLATSQAR
jgi:hypothetical protein